MASAPVDEMPLLCELGWHKADPLARWNAGYYFTTCGRCGRDLVRTAYGGWRVPKGFKIVWQATPPESATSAELVPEPAAERPNRDQMELPIQEVLRHMEAEEQALEAFADAAEEEPEPIADAAPEDDEPVEELPDEAADAELLNSDRPREETEVEAEGGAEAEAVAEVEPGPEPEPEHDLEPEPERDLEPELEPDLEPETAPEAVPEPLLRAELEPDPEHEVGPDPEPELGPDPEPQLDAELMAAAAASAAAKVPAVDDFMEDDWFMNDEPGYDSWDRAAEHQIDTVQHEIVDDENEHIGNRSGKIRYGKEVASVAPAAPPTFLSMLRMDEEEPSEVARREVPEPPVEAAPPPARSSGNTGAVVTLVATFGVLLALIAAVGGGSNMPQTQIATPAPSEAPAAPQAQAGGPTAAALARPEETGFVTASLLNCRTAPAEQAEPVRILQRGEPVRVLAVEPAWASVSHRGRQCWASTRYLSSEQPL